MLREPHIPEKFWVGSLMFRWSLMFRCRINGGSLMFRWSLKILQVQTF